MMLKAHIEKFIIQIFYKYMNFSIKTNIKTSTDTVDKCKCKCGMFKKTIYT